MNQKCHDEADQQTLPKVIHSIWYLLKPKRCLVRLMAVLCHSRTEQICFAFFDFLDFIAIDQSWPLAIPLV